MICGRNAYPKAFTAEGAEDAEFLGWHLANQLRPRPRSSAFSAFSAVSAFRQQSVKAMSGAFQQRIGITPESRA